MRAREMVSKVGTKAGLVAVGGALLATGVGVGAATTVGPWSGETVSDSSVVTTPATTPTTEAPSPTVAAVNETPEPTPIHDETQAAVTTPAQAPAPETIPAPQVNPDGSLPEGWLPPQNPGEPPRAPIPDLPGGKLPGETGYVPPAG